MKSDFVVWRELVYLLALALSVGLFYVLEQYFSGQRGLQTVFGCGFWVLIGVGLARLAHGGRRRKRWDRVFGAAAAVMLAVYAVLAGLMLNGIVLNVALDMLAAVLPIAAGVSLALAFWQPRDSEEGK